MLSGSEPVLLLIYWLRIIGNPWSWVPVNDSGTSRTQTTQRTHKTPQVPVNDSGTLGTHTNNPIIHTTGKTSYIGKVQQSTFCRLTFCKTEGRCRPMVLQFNKIFIIFILTFLVFRSQGLQDQGLLQIVSLAGPFLINSHKLSLSLVTFFQSVIM